MVDDIFYHGFILIESCIPTFELEKYDLSESPFRESIEDDIVTSLSGEHHIFGRIGEVRKCWKDLLIEFTEDLILRSLNDGSLHILLLEECKYAHECHTQYESEDQSRDEGDDIHK